MANREITALLSENDVPLNPEIQAQREKLKSNAKEYEVKPGDTVAKIAAASGLENYADLVDFNRLLGHPFVEKGNSGKNYVLKPGQILYVPGDSKVFAESVATIRRISESMAEGERVAKRDVSILKREAVRWIFPNRPQSIWASLLSGFAGSQEKSLDPELPRIVDIARQSSVSCANLVRTLMAYSVNPKDLSASERAFFRKQNIDAWMLPEELRKTGFVQKESLIPHFDPSRIGDGDPFKADKREDYEKGVVSMGKYLETQGKPFSLVPIYFRHSHYRWIVAEYNRGKPESERHYNTHQSMFLRNSDVRVDAFEVPEIKNGQRIPFGGDKERLKREITEFSKKVESAVSASEEAKKGILTALETEWADDGKSRKFAIDKTVDRYVAHLSWEKRDALATAISKLFESENAVKIRQELATLIKYPVTEEDARYLIALQSRKRKTIEGVRAVREVVSGRKPSVENAPIVLDAGPGNGLSWSALGKAVDKYNASLSAIEKRKADIEERRQRLDAIDKADVAKRDEIVKLSLQNAKALTDIRTAETDREAAKAEVLALLSGDDPEIRKRLTYLERRVAKILGEETPGTKTGRFMKALEANDRETLVKFRQTDADIDHLRSLLKNRERFADAVSSVKAQLGLSSGAKTVPENEFLKNLPAWHPLLAGIAKYNAAVSSAESGRRKIAENEEKMKVKKEIPVTDFVYNFVASRADYSGASQAEGKNRILDGMKKYASIVKVSINGSPVDLAGEFAKPAQERTKVSPEDRVEFSGPLMVDGMHRIHPDADKRENMNARTRFFFEFAVTDTFYPTEIIEPGESSSFARTGFENPASGLKVKGTYDLRYKRDENGAIVRDRKGRPMSENLAEVIARNVPLFEKEAFAKLDPADPQYSEKHAALVSRYYSLQIRALQLSGFIQDENTLNPGATNLNRPIPYFAPEGISEAFAGHVKQAKAARRAENAETQAFREFVRIELFPGDTYATVFSNLAAYVGDSRSHFAKYPNLAFLSGLNDLQKKDFLIKVLGGAMKTGNAPDAASLLENRIRAGGKYLVTYASINAAVGELREAATRPSIAPVLRTADSAALSLAVPFVQNRALVERALYVESYETPSGKWYKPDGSRRAVKETLEEYPILQIVKSLNSYGDFQLRVKTLRNGWNDEWPTKSHLSKAFALLSHPDVVAYLDEVRKNGGREVGARIASDLSVVERASLIVSKANPTKQDFATLTDLLVKLLRLDDGTWSNAVGKIIGASVLNDKLNLHFQKLNGVLQAAWEDPRAVTSTENGRLSYEDSVLLMNNMGERNVLFGLTENRLLRIIEKSGIIEKAGKKLTYPELQTSFFSGSIKYGTDTFVAHISLLVDQIAQSRKLPAGTNAELAIIHGLFSFCNRVLEADQKWGPSRERLITEAIIAFHKDPDLRKALAEYPYDPADPSKRIDPGMLPTRQEFAWNGFRDVFFNYVRKGSEVEKAAVAATAARPSA